MTLTAHFSRRFRFLRLLCASLLAGALYDALFAGAMLFAPGLPARLLGLPLPGEEFYLWILAILIAMLAALYFAAARDPRRYSGIVAVAIGGRLAGAGAFALAALRSPELSGLLPLAAADLALGLSHALFWWPVRS